MSLILEALRKSEAERRRGAMPDLHAELPSSPMLARSTVPGWVLWMLAATAAIALLSWVLHGRWQRPPVPMVTAARPASATPAEPALRPVARLSPPPSPPAVAPPPPVVAARPAAATPLPAPPQDSVRVPTPVPPAAAPATAAVPVDDDALQLSDLSVDERKALPPLKLSMHLWDQDPARRFVILDGNRLREGDRAGDAVITAITTDGVLLDWNGRRIKLSIR